MQHVKYYASQVLSRMAVHGGHVITLTLSLYPSHTLLIPHIHSPLYAIRRHILSPVGAFTLYHLAPVSLKPLAANRNATKLGVARTPRGRGLQQLEWLHLHEVLTTSR